MARSAWLAMDAKGARERGRERERENVVARVARGIVARARARVRERDRHGGGGRVTWPRARGLVDRPRGLEERRGEGMRGLRVERRRVAGNGEVGRVSLSPSFPPAITLSPFLSPPVSLARLCIPR